MQNESYLFLPGNQILLVSLNIEVREVGRSIALKPIRGFFYYQTLESHVVVLVP